MKEAAKACGIVRHWRMPSKANIESPLRRSIAIRSSTSTSKGCSFNQKALPLLKDGGSIILNASIAASIGMEAFSVYSATKAAVRSFARTWTTDLKQRKIRVNAISPGTVPTEGYRSLGDEDQIADFAAQQATQIPLGRVGQPDEIAKAVVFLASDDSSFVAGAELVVDGGMIAV